MAERSTKRKGSIEQLIADAHDGDGQALVAFCERMKILALAIGLNAGQSWKDALVAVPANVKLLCEQVLEGQLTPHQWQENIISQVHTAAQMDRSDMYGNEDHLGLSGLGAIPRVARRRSVRKAMATLPLWHLAAVLAVHLDDCRPADLVGFVAGSEREVRESLTAAHAVLLQAMQDVESGVDDQETP